MSDGRTDELQMQIANCKSQMDARTSLLCDGIGLLLAGCAPLVPSPQSPVPTWATGIDPEAWAQIPAGTFHFGQHDEMVTIAAPYEMMVTDVTNAQYARYLNAALAEGAVKIDGDSVVGYYPGDEFHGHKHEVEIKAGDWLHVPLTDPSLRLTFDGTTFGVKPGYENHPMTVVTWFGAKAYCEFSGGRLPSEAEWERAARGDDERPFPWGDEIALNNANFYASRDPFEATAGKQRRHHARRLLQRESVRRLPDAGLGQPVRPVRHGRQRLAVGQRHHRRHPRPPLEGRQQGGLRLQPAHLDAQRGPAGLCESECGVSVCEVGIRD